MTDEITITEDGRLLCPHCSNNALQALQGEEVELRYHILHHRKDISKARFNKQDDMLVIVGDPFDGDTLEVYDEYLFCPRCGSRHNIPWREDGDQQQDQVEHEGDFLLELKPDLPQYHCPKCGSSDHVQQYEDYIVAYDLIENDDGELEVSDDGEVAWEGGGDNHRLCCWQCDITWSRR